MTSASSSSPRPLLLLFRAAFGCCRLAEFEAVARRLGPDRPATWTWGTEVMKHAGGDVGPPLVQELPHFPAEDHEWLANSAARSVGCRGAFEIWGRGDTIEDCAADAESLSAAAVRERIGGSWRVDSWVLGSKRSLHPEQRTARIETFASTLAHLEERPVDLDDPDHHIWLVEDRQRLSNSELIPQPPSRFMLLCELKPSRPSIQEDIHRLDVKKRAFIATSTTAADCALSLANIALAECTGPDFTVVDPFCGSGGLLLPAAALGAQTVGADLDWRVISENRIKLHMGATPSRPTRGSEEVRLWDSFDEADLPRPKALLTLDANAPGTATALLEANGGRPYDALLCDPPYGRREYHQGVEGWEGALAYKVDQSSLKNTLEQLLVLASKLLRPGGRIVFMAPTRSKRDHAKPSTDELTALLQVEGARHGQALLSLGVDVVHSGLCRAAIAMIQR